MIRTLKVSNGLSSEIKEKALKELRLGYLNLSDECFEQAKLNFLLTLQYDSKCADAYWGLMLAKFQISSEDELHSNPVKYKSAIYLPECKQALDNADEDLKNNYINLLERIVRINEGENY